MQTQALPTGRKSPEKYDEVAPDERKASAVFAVVTVMSKGQLPLVARGTSTV